VNEINLVLLGVFEGSTEYYYRNCYQLRLDISGKRTTCGNCGSKDIVMGPVGTIDKPLNEGEGNG